MKLKSKYFGIIGIIILVIIFLNIDLEKLLLALKSVNLIWFLPAYLFLVLSTIIKAYRWKYVTDKLKINLSLIQAIKIYFQALFAELTPGMIGEFLLRAHFLKKASKVNYPKALFSTAFSVFIDLWVTAIEAVIGVVFLLLIFNLDISFAIPIFIILLIVILFFYFLKQEKIMRFCFSLFSKFVLKKDQDSFVKYLKKMDISIIFVSTILDVIAMIAFATSFFFVGVAMNITVPFIIYLICEPLLSIVVTMPFTFSGLGAREPLLIFLFSLVNVSAENAVLFALFWFVMKLLLSIPGLVINFIEKSD